MSWGLAFSSGVWYTVRNMEDATNSMSNELEITRHICVFEEERGVRPSRILMTPELFEEMSRPKDVCGIPTEVHRRIEGSRFALIRD